MWLSCQAFLDPFIPCGAHDLFLVSWKEHSILYHGHFFFLRFICRGRDGERERERDGDGGRSRDRFRFLISPLLAFVPNPMCLGTMDIWVKLSNSSGTRRPQEAGEVHCIFDFVGSSGVAYPQHQSGVDTFDDSLHASLKARMCVLSLWFGLPSAISL